MFDSDLRTDSGGPRTELEVPGSAKPKWISVLRSELDFEVGSEDWVPVLRSELDHVQFRPGQFRPGPEV